MCRIRFWFLMMWTRCIERKVCMRLNLFYISALVVVVKKMTMVWATCWYVLVRGCWISEVEMRWWYAQKVKKMRSLLFWWVCVRRCVYLYARAVRFPLVCSLKRLFWEKSGREPLMVGEDKRWLHSFVPRCQRSDYRAQEETRSSSYSYTP